MSEWLTASGELVEIEDDLLRIVEEIHFRFPSLRVKYLDPNQHPDLTDSPYIVVDQNDNVVAKAWALDQRLLDQLMAAHSKSAKDLIKEDELRRAVLAAERKRVADERTAEAKDKMLHVFKSSKTSYTLPNAEGEIFKVSDG